jgi:hypothetical protein
MMKREKTDPRSVTMTCYPYTVRQVHGSIEISGGKLTNMWYGVLYDHDRLDDRTASFESSWCFFDELYLLRGL